MDSVKMVPFYRNTTYYSDPEGTEPDRGRDVQLWPLFRRQRDRVGTVEFKLLAPIPFAAWDEFEANYDWLWTIFSYAEMGDREKVHLLSGLLGYERDAEDEGLRLLWLLRIPL